MRNLTQPSDFPNRVAYINAEGIEIISEPLSPYVRAFLSWLEKVRPNLAIPMHIVAVQSEYIELMLDAFAGITRLVLEKLEMSDGSIMVCISVKVRWGGKGMWPLERRFAPCWKYSNGETELRYLIFDDIMQFINFNLAATTALCLFSEDGDLWVEAFHAVDPKTLFKVVTIEGKCLRATGAMTLEEE